MTTRDIINEVIGNEVDLPSDIVKNAINNAEIAATDRINGKIDNNGYKQRMKKINDDLEKKKREIFLINQLKNKQKVQGGQVGSDSVGARVSTQV